MQEKNYCVYLHKRKTDGVVFYVGSGRPERPYWSGGRTKDWSSTVEKFGYEVEIILSNLTKQEAIERETEFIQNPLKEWELVNKDLPTKVVELDYNFLSDLFYYDETSPTGLRYNKDIYRLKNVIHNKKGDVAGSLHIMKGRIVAWRIKVNFNGVKKQCKVHRIIWVLLNGTIDDSMVIDHIDNNPTNNRKENLRLVSYRVNGRNKLPSNASKDTNIVGIIKRPKDFLAQLRDASGKRTTKSYSFKKYGKEKALYLAAKARYEYLVSQPEHLKFSDTHSCLEELIKIITNFESENINGTKSLGA